MPLVTPALERIMPGRRLPGAPCFREPVGGLTSASAARPALSPQDSPRGLTSHHEELILRRRAFSQLLSPGV